MRLKGKTASIYARNVKFDLFVNGDGEDAGDPCAIGGDGDELERFARQHGATEVNHWYRDDRR